MLCITDTNFDEFGGQTTTHGAWRWLGGLLAASVVATVVVGCTSEREKAKQAIVKEVQTCRDAQTDGPFYTVELFDGEFDEILQKICAKEVTNFEMSSDVSAHAFTGPVRWAAGVDEDTDLWTLYKAEWSALGRAKNALDKDDPTEKALAYAAESLAKLQRQVPTSAWVRLRRLQVVLDLREKTRSDQTAHPITMGSRARKVYDATVAWAEERDDLNTQIEAQYLALRHTKRYLDRIDMVLSTDGSGDEWLIKAAEQAEDNGESDKAEEYREELRETRKQRKETQKEFSARRKRTVALACKQAARLQPAGLDDSDLQKRVVALKGSLNCMKKAKKVAGGTE